MLPLLASIAVSGALAIAGSARRPRTLHYLFKPLATALIILLALFGALPGPDGYALWLLAGLILSLAGDVFLMLPRDRFVAGLGSFLLAHLAYLAAFLPDGGPRAWLALFLLSAAAGAIFALLAPRLGSLRGPVLAYMAAIVVMAWQAAARFQALGGGGPLLALFGALLFVFSDAALALNRFRAPFPGAQIVVLGSYYAAQTLLALSVGD